MEASQYPPGRELPGTVYRVVRHLATGGMGSVYDVEDTTIGKRYVLKTLHPQLVAREDLARRMKEEAKTLAKLQHPNIVDVVTAGVTTDNLRMPFYVMERLNGQNLRVVLEKKGSLELPHCFRIAIDVLDALEHAHENAVIHRDVKPENIFLHRNTNGTTTTKLLDFGIMRLLDRKMSHTQGKFIGTLRYASPEQVMGGELGPATDIYSLGVVLYEMICGRGPFDDAGDAYAIGAAHAQKPPPPLSQFVEVPPHVEALVLASLAKNPAERPRDCFTFASELRRMLRVEETAPKSSTAVNVLSSVPDTRVAAADPYLGTEASPVPSPPPTALQGRRASAPVVAATEQGMPPPSMGGTLPFEAQAVADVAVAPTVATDPNGPAPAEPLPARAISVPSAPPFVDREAVTHASDPFGTTRRLAQNGTMMDEGLPPPAPDDAVRAALGERASLEVPPVSGGPNPSGSGEIVFPPSHGYVGGTGPMAAEASTRPPERSTLLPLVAAALVGASLVGGAALLVTKPWKRFASAPPATAPAEPPGAATATGAGDPGGGEPAPPPEKAEAPPALEAPPLAPAPTASASAAASPSAAAAATTAPPASSIAEAPRATAKPRATAPTSTHSHERRPAPTAEPKPSTTAKSGPKGATKPEDVPFD